MPGVNATIDLHIQAKQTGAAGLGTPQVLVDIIKQMNFSVGTAAVGQANVLYEATRTLAASGTENLDLAGVLQDALGATIATAEVVAIYFAAAQGNTNDVQVRRPATNGVPLFSAVSAGIDLGPGDFSVRTYRNGIAVVAATGDLITVTNGGGVTPVTYDIIVIGRTVAA